MASSRIQKVMVTTPSELEQTITGYIAQGFTIVNRSEGSVTLQKKKEFSVLWGVIGFLICLLPLIIYLIVYASRPEYEIVEITVAPAGTHEHG